MAWEVRKKKPERQKRKTTLISVHPKDRGIFIWAKTNKTFADHAPQPGSLVEVLVDHDETRLAFRVVVPEDAANPEGLWEVKGRASGATEIPCAEVLQDIEFLERSYTAQVFEYEDECVLGLDWSEEVSIQYPPEAQGAYVEVDHKGIHLGPSTLDLSFAPSLGTRVSLEADNSNNVLWMVPDPQGPLTLLERKGGGAHLDCSGLAWLSRVPPGRYRAGIRTKGGHVFLAIRHTEHGRFE